MERELLLRALDAIGERTPMLTDCGLRCGAACCSPDEDEQGGVYLFPGEEPLLNGAPWGHFESDDFAPMLVCDGPCDRDHRPLACRIFPLTPVRNAEGKWTVRMDIRAQAMCPLTRSGTRGLDPEFVRGVIRAMRVIAKDPDGQAFLERWEALEASYHLVL